jgi:PAS domain S-box-containing protein
LINTKNYKGSNNKIKGSEQKHSKIFDTIREGILVIEFETGKIVDANSYVISMLGYSYSELVNNPIWDLDILANAQELRDSLVNFKSGNNSPPQSIPLKTRDGSIINTDILLGEFIMDNTKFIHISIRDISIFVQEKEKHLERIKVLTKLTKLQERTNEVILNITEDLENTQNLLNIAKANDDAILASIADAVLACDTQGVILLFNKSAEKLTGIASKDAIGKNYKKIIKFENDIEGKKYIDPIYEIVNDEINHKKVNLTLVIKNKKISVLLSAAKIINNKNQSIGYVAIFHDDSVEREIDKIKSEFVSIASHQLRTPLTTINWSTENLLSETSGVTDPVQQKEIIEIQKASKRMVRLVDAFLNVSRLEMGTVIVEPEKVDIIDAVRITLKELTPKILIKKLIVQETYDPEISTYSTDPKLLNVILLNLLSNATKYTPSEGKISIKIKRRDSKFQIKISDTGIGIPKNQQKMIFSKLFRADNAQEVDSSGTGLGLYIVKEIVSSLGGEISFVSNVGKGSTFTVSLPISGSKQISGTKQLISNI